MTDISVRLVGLKRLERKVKKLKGQARIRAQKAVATTAIAVQRDAKRLAPVDTGRLRASIEFKLRADGLEAEVFSDVEYAKFVEFGTEFMEEQPFLFPAWRKNRKKLLAKLRKIASVKK